MPIQVGIPDESTFLGCLVGGALGDALGYPIEFEHSSDAILRRFGTAPPKRLAFAGPPPARVSDDTQMTLFTADGMIHAYLRAEAKGIVHGPSMLARAYVRWYHTQTRSRPGTPKKSGRSPGLLLSTADLYARRAPGNTCMSALHRLAPDPNALPRVDSPPNDSKGCGAVMRVAPIGLAASSVDHAFELGVESTVLTHGHPSGYLSAGYCAALIYLLARGATWDEAFDAADEFLAGYPGREELVAVVGKARALARKGPLSPSTIEQLGGGWTGEEALAIALLCALTIESDDAAGFEAALWRSVAHGGDSDSTGSITGNLLGARLGTAVLPPAWLEDLELRPLIERVGRDLHTAMTNPDALPDADYPFA